jgi:DNA-binding response OmpR family regulator
MEAARSARTAPAGTALQEASGSHRQPVACPKCGHMFQAPPATAHSTSAHPKVLLIEDQNYFAELAREALASDCETTVVANLAGARAAMAQGSFELVILDLGLEEGQDGAQLLSVLRQKGIPVLVFTARDETELYGGVWDTLQGAGATDILIKGMNVGDELRQKVKSLLSRPRA